MTPVSRFSQRWFRTVAALVLVLVAFAATPVLAGPVGLQATGGWFTDSDDFFLGAGARMGAGTLTVIPNAEWLFVSSGKQYTLNVDGTMSVLPLAAATGYLGAGLGWLFSEPDGGERTSETVINLIAGAGINAIPLKPFAQFKWIVADGDDPLVFSIGARF
jgi:hypothetical protein